jgi:hypothetical protein
MDQASRLRPFCLMQRLKLIAPTCKGGRLRDSSIGRHGFPGSLQLQGDGGAAQLRACLSECLLDAIEFAHELLDVYRHSGYRPRPSQPLQLAAQRGHTQGAHTCTGRFQGMGGARAIQFSV